MSADYNLIVASVNFPAVPAAMICVDSPPVRGNIVHSEAIQAADFLDMRGRTGRGREGPCSGVVMGAMVPVVTRKMTRDCDLCCSTGAGLRCFHPADWRDWAVYMMTPVDGADRTTPDLPPPPLGVLFLGIRMSDSDDEGEMDGEENDVLDWRAWARSDDFRDAVLGTASVPVPAGPSGVSVRWHTGQRDLSLAVVCSPVLDYDWTRSAGVRGATNTLAVRDLRAVGDSCAAADLRSVASRIVAPVPVVRSKVTEVRARFVDLVGVVPDTGDTWMAETDDVRARLIGHRRATYTAPVDEAHAEVTDGCRGG